VVFDLLWLDGQDLTGFTYLDRRHLLVELVEPGTGLLVPAVNSVTAPTCLRPPGRISSKGLWPNGSTVSTGRVRAARCGARSRSGRALSSWSEAGIPASAAGRANSEVCCSATTWMLRGLTPARSAPGFKARKLDRLAGLLGALSADESPFTPAPPPVVARTSRWVRPELVAEVTFGEWTDEGILRHASYIATQNDIEPRAVVRET
jgi:bifunctional non-homologous end joining protein LigD